MEFSLENRSVLKAREKRMEKSKEKNPLWKKKNASSTNIKGKLFHSYTSFVLILCLKFLVASKYVLYGLALNSLHQAK